MKRLILLAVVLAVCTSLAGWRGRFDEQFAAASSCWTPAELNPIAWYKGDGNALDAMGNYDGTWVGTEAYADGPTGQAFDFNGSSALIHNKTFEISNISISAWVYRLEGYFNCDILCSGYDESETFILQMNYNGGYRFFSRYRNSFNIAVADSSVISAHDKWEHVCATHDGTTTKIYIDGSLDVSLNRPGSMRLPLYNLVVGRRGSSSKYYMKGRLDDVMLFDRVLAADEIEKLYNESINKDGAEW